MNRLIVGFSLLAIGLTISPARADYALVRFEDGWCRIWWDSAGTPWGAGWTKIAIGMPDWLIASAALSNARAGRVPVEDSVAFACPVVPAKSRDPGTKLDS